MESELLSRQLVRRIMAYYAKDNHSPRIWVEKERLGQFSIWVVRSDIVMTVPKL